MSSENVQMIAQQLSLRSRTVVAKPADSVAASRVAPGDYHGGHVQREAHRGPPSPDGSTAPPQTAVPIEGRHPHQGRDLPAVQGAQFRQVSQQSEGKLLSQAGDEPQEVVLLTPYGTLAESLPQVLVQVLQILLQPADTGLNAGTDGDVGGSPGDSSRRPVGSASDAFGQPGS